MRDLEPFLRDSGAGPAVICIHANASSSSQWRPLAEELAATNRVLAPDCYGSGRSPDWNSDRIISLSDEVQFLEPVFSKAGSSFTLVGHSYGAAVALIAASRFRDRVRSLVLYEPTLFSVIDAESPPPNEADGIRNTVAAAAKLLDQGDTCAAARVFIDYWMGVGAWDAMPEDRKPAISSSVRNVRRWAHALFGERTPLEELANLQMPTLILTGERSTASAHGVSRRLLGALPRASSHAFQKLGHMGPVTHAEEVNAEIAKFLKVV